MPSLVERTRQVIGAENDDYFQPDTILYYLNKSQRKVVSGMIQLEREAKKSFRVLDPLRDRESVVLTTNDFSANGDYYIGQVSFPTSLIDYQYIRYNTRTRVRELTASERFRLDWGNLVPTEYECYFHVVGSSAEAPLFELFLHEQPDGDADTLYINYYIKPTAITMSAETMTELPDQAENAVVYGAAMLMGIQENNENQKSFAEIYNEELQKAAY